MDIRQLRYFMAIANVRSYSLAAKSLFVTQPTLTWTVQKLESHLNTKLFEISDKGLQLTKSGKLLYERGSKIVEEFDELEELIRNQKNTIKGSLRIGTTVISVIRHMKKISELISSNPDLDITLVQKGSKRIQEMISCGDLELGLVSFPIYYDNLELISLPTPFPSYDVSVVVSCNSQLASKKAVKLQDLKDEKISLLSEDYVIGNVFYDRCKEAGFAPNIIFQNGNWEVLLENVAIAESVTILPTEFSSIATRKDVKWIKLEDKIN